MEGNGKCSHFTTLIVTKDTTFYHVAVAMLDVLLLKILIEVTDMEVCAKINVDNVLCAPALNFLFPLERNGEPGLRNFFASNLKIFSQIMFFLRNMFFLHFISNSKSFRKLVQMALLLLLSSRREIIQN